MGFVKTTIKNILDNKIVSVKLEKHIFSPNDVKRALEAISTSTTVEYLTIVQCRTDMCSLIDTLCKNKKISGLKLCYINLDINIFSKALPNFTNLTRLEINDKFSKESLEVLTKALASNTSIKSLILSSPDFNDEYVSLITHMLATNNITSLSLESTNIGDNGLEELMLSPNNLNSLCLKNTAISINGVKLLTKYIIHNTKITNIFLDKNYLVLSKLLARNCIHTKYNYAFDIPLELNNLIQQHVSNYCYYLV